MVGKTVDPHTEKCACLHVLSVHVKDPACVLVGLRYYWPTADELLSLFSAHCALTCHYACAGGVRIPVGELLESPNDQLNFTLYDKTKQPSGTIQASTSKHSVTLQLGANPTKNEALLHM